MKRKKREESAFSWPVIGIDLPYPEHVREALRLVAEETQRRLRETCEHEQAHSTGSFRATYRYDEMWGNSWHCITCGYNWTTHDRRSAKPPDIWLRWQQLMEADKERRRNCKHERTRKRFVHRGLDRGLHADKGLEEFCTDCEMVLGFEAEPPRYSRAHRSGGSWSASLIFPSDRTENSSDDVSGLEMPLLGAGVVVRGDPEPLHELRLVGERSVLNARPEVEGELVAQFDWIYHQGNTSGFTDTMIRQLESLADHVYQVRQRRAGRLRESNEGWGNDAPLPDRDKERQRPDGAQAS